MTRLCMALVPYTSGGSLNGALNGPLPASLIEVTIAELNPQRGGWICAAPFCGFLAEDHGAVDNMRGPGKRKLYTHWLVVHRGLLYLSGNPIGEE